MNYEDVLYQVEPMQVSDIPEIMAIERQSFQTPWTPDAYRYELAHNPHAYYYVVRPQKEATQSATIEEMDGWRIKLRRLLGRPKQTAPPILGYAGFWFAAGEAHISTIAVHPQARRQGLGELLMIQIIEEAMALEADFVTLEVRVSSHGAQRLYEKYGFKRKDRRRGYYSNNREDAWIMTVDSLRDPEFQALFERNKRMLRKKLLAVREPAPSS